MRVLEQNFASEEKKDQVEGRWSADQRYEGNATPTGTWIPASGEQSGCSSREQGGEGAWVRVSTLHTAGFSWTAPPPCCHIAPRPPTNQPKTVLDPELEM